jgi:hypothetical protein
MGQTRDTEGNERCHLARTAESHRQPEIEVLRALGLNSDVEV